MSLNEYIPPSDRRYLTIPEAVQFSGVKRTRLYAAIKSGTIEARKLGARTLVVTASLERFVDSEAFRPWRAARKPQ